MREIEVKARLTNPSKTLETLMNLGCVFAEPIHQHDVIYLEPKHVGLDTHQGNVLRIRTQNDKILFTLKRDVTNELDCIEKELEIKDAATMHDILLMLGFVEVVQVKKQRAKAKFQGYEICCDEVEHLGRFIEVEKLVEDDADAETQNEIFSFLKNLGVSESDRVFQGYDTMIYNLQNTNARK